MSWQDMLSDSVPPQGLVLLAEKGSHSCQLFRTPGQLLHQDAAGRQAWAKIQPVLPALNLEAMPTEEEWLLNSVQGT